MLRLFGGLVYAFPIGCDPQKIIGQHRGAHQDLEPLPAFEQAPFHATPTK